MKDTNSVPEKTPLTISDLAQHYIDLFKLPDTLKTLTNLSAKLKRTLKEKIIQEYPETTLWDSITIPNKWRKISSEDFEQQCFEDLARYIERNYDGHYDADALEATRKEVRERSDEYYQELAVEMTRREFEYLSSVSGEDLYKQQEEMKDRMWAEPFPYNPNSPEVRQKGHGIMLEALYNIFFDGFNWELLAQDMTNCQIMDAQHVTAANARAQTRLRDDNNYLGKKRKSPFASPAAKK